jgi:hypothetical protein
MLPLLQKKMKQIKIHSSFTNSHYSISDKFSLYMNSYYDNKKAAEERIASGNFALRENRLGQMVEEKPYHIMYSYGFPSYFIYMIFRDHGEMSDSVHNTWWGFDLYEESEEHSPYYRETPPDYEHSLSVVELIPWLDKYYGSLTSIEHYQYLLDIVDSSYSQYKHSPVKHARVIKWLAIKIEQFSTPSSSSIELGIKWNSSRAQLVELIYALSQSGAITAIKPGGLEGIIERLGKALGVEATTPVSVVVNSIRNKRSDKNRTPLLTKLLDSYTKWLNEEK